jgi:predicted DNA-binding transcriptional regulator AlpA
MQLTAPASGAHLIRLDERLGLSRREAAAYIGVSPTLFDEMVKDGRMPPPKQINSRKVWLRTSLEKAFAELPDAGQEHESMSPWQDCA